MKLPLTMYGTVRIGKLIETLENFNKSKICIFDTHDFSPSNIHSYRGYYDHLAIGADFETKFQTVEQVISILKSAIGKEFEGYKGGEFRMNLDTPLWVAGDSGTWPGGFIVGIYEESNQVIIETRQQE